MTIALVVLAPVLLLALAYPVFVGWQRARGLMRPRRDANRVSGAKDLPVREITLSTRDGVALSTWVLPGDGPHTVVICHPIGRGKRSVLPHMRILHQAGHHVVAYDLRNHGASGDDPVLRSMSEKFTADLADVVSHVSGLHELGPGGQTGVLALSFSTWPAVHMLRADVPVAAVACDSGPGLDIPAALRRYFEMQRRLLPRVLRAGPGCALARWAFQRTGSSLLAVRGWPVDFTTVRQPLLFIGAGRDTLMPPADVAEVADLAPTATMWTAPNAIHVNAHRLDRAEYTQRLTGFFATAFDTARERAHG